MFCWTVIPTNVGARFILTCGASSSCASYQHFLSLSLPNFLPLFCSCITYLGLLSSPTLQAANEPSNRLHLFSFSLPGRTSSKVWPKKEGRKRNNLCVCCSNFINKFFWYFFSFSNRCQLTFRGLSGGDVWGLLVTCRNMRPGREGGEEGVSVIMIS